MYEAIEYNKTLVARFKGGPYDGEELLLAPGEYSHAPPNMIAQPDKHPVLGGCWACYTAPDDCVGWPEPESDENRIIQEYKFEGWRSAKCDFDS